MATVEILKGVAGADFRWKRGDRIEMDDDQAQAWADGVRARLIDTTSEPDPARTAPRGPGGPIETTEDRPAPDRTDEKPARRGRRGSSNQR